MIRDAILDDMPRLLEMGELTEGQMQHEQMVQDLAAAIIDSGMEPANLEPNHYFAHGTYTRELFIAKGTTIAGKIHRYPCITVILFGRCIFTTDQGVFEVIGPKTMVTGTGSKAVYALEDTLWLTVHPWDGEPDLEKVEEYVIVPSVEALEFEAKERLGV